MRYLMKARLFSWGSDFTIQDDAGHDRYFVDGKAFTIGDQLSFQDMTGSELLHIRQRVLSWGPTYEVCRGDAIIAVVRQHLFTFLQCRFTVDVEGPDDLIGTGDFLDHEYRLTRHNRTVARISKKWFTLTDTYGVDIEEGEDDVLLLAATVVIDMACHDE